MKKFLNYAGKRFFVDVPPYVTMPLFIVWLLAVYAAIFGGSTIFDLYWLRVGSLFVVMISALIIYLWPER